jgi:hypothetical protein
MNTNNKFKACCLWVLSVLAMGGSILSAVAPVLIIAYYIYWAAHQPGAKEYDEMQRSRHYEKEIRDGVAEVYGTNYQSTPQDDALTRAIAREATKQNP